MTKSSSDTASATDTVQSRGPQPDTEASSSPERSRKRRLVVEAASSDCRTRKSQRLDDGVPSETAHSKTAVGDEPQPLIERPSIDERFDAATSTGERRDIAAANVRDPGQDLVKVFRIQTDFTYGITVTCRSWLVGVRKLIRHEHAKMLASHVCMPQLPQELVDTVVDVLFDSDLLTIERKSDKEPRSLHYRPEAARCGFPVDREVQRRIDATGIYANTLRLDDSLPLDSSPRRTSSEVIRGDGPSFEGLVLVQASRVRPEIGLVDVAGWPRGVAAQKKGDGSDCEVQHHDIFHPRGNVTTMCCPNEGDDRARGRSYDRAIYWPSNERETEEWPRIGRFLNEVIASWDADAAERVVKLLGLEVVPASTHDHDPTKPSLVSFQHLSYGWRPVMPRRD